MKGTDKIEWRGSPGADKEAAFSGIKMETVHYWMRLPVPVFLFVADLQERKLHFAAVKEQVRVQYSKYLEQETMGFTLRENHQLRPTKEGVVDFLALYFQEKFHNRFVTAIRTIFVHWRHYLEFIQGKQNLDSFLQTKPFEELLFVDVYQTLHDLSDLLLLKWDLEKISDILRKDRETWKEGYLLHYQTFTDVLPSLEAKFFEIVQKARILIMETKKEYWSISDPVLFRIAHTLDHLKPGYFAFSDG